MPSSSDFTTLSVRSAEQWRERRHGTASVVVDRDGLTLRADTGYAPRRTLGVHEGLERPVDLAVDRCGTIFVLDGARGRIASYDPATERLEWIDCIGGAGSEETELVDGRAIAVSDRNLFVADLGRRRVVAFARMSFQVRWVFAPPAPEVASPPDDQGDPPYLVEPFAPYDLAAGPDDEAYVLDRANAQVHRLDAGGRWRATIGAGSLVDPTAIAIDAARDDLACVLLFLRAGRSPARHAARIRTRLRTAHDKLAPEERRQLDEALATVLPVGTGDAIEERLDVLEALLASRAPAAIALVEKLAALVGRHAVSVHVLDAGVGRVLTFAPDGELLHAFPLIADGLVRPSGLAVGADGRLYVGDARALAPGADEDRFLHRFSPGGELELSPITAHQGRCDAVVADSRHALYVLDGERHDIRVLEPRPLYPSSGEIVLGPFDSGIPSCVWHNVVTETTLPELAHVRLRHHAAEDPALDGDVDAVRWSDALLDPPDALLRAVGRYLWLRVTLSGDGTTSPRVRALALRFERLSYLRYLPAIYQENELSRDFLERFLALFETELGAVEEAIGAIGHYLDARAVPDEFLPWLEQWVGIGADDNWPLEKRRRFLADAARLFKMRGTRRGFEEVIALLTGAAPLIVEAFQLACIEDADLRAVYARVFGTDRFHFCVLLPPQGCPDDATYLAVKRLVDADRPAHTSAGVRPLQPWIHLDMHSYLGINTYLTRPEPRLGIQSVLGRDSVMTDIDEAGQLERRARLGIDTRLT